MQFGILSGPDDLCKLVVFKSFSSLSRSIVIGVMLFLALILVVVRLLSDVVVKTD